MPGFEQIGNHPNEGNRVTEVWELPGWDGPVEVEAFIHPMTGQKIYTVDSKLKLQSFGSEEYEKIASKFKHSKEIR